MPVVRHIHQLPTRHGPGWSQQDWADAAIFGEAVPMRARRHRLDAGATGPGVALGAAEFWAPPPTGTVWTVPGDRCTWAPAGPPAEASRGRPA